MSEKRLPAVYPTRIFGALMFVLAAIWYGAASQNNAASYLLLFATLALLLVSIPHTLLNLSGLTVTSESIKPTFAGQEACVSLELLNRSTKARRSCVVSLPGLNTTGELVDEVAAREAVRVTIRFPTEKRGVSELSAIQLRSMYPLGFLAASRKLPIHQHFTVYPAPLGDPALPHAKRHRHGAATAQAGEGDDYAGIRAYIPGESQRHIDWKAVARGQPLMTKQFTAEADDIVQLDFASIAGNTEQKLSQLALWIIEAERARLRYALRLPLEHIAAGSGQLHYHRCLRALALVP